MNFTVFFFKVFYNPSTFVFCQGIICWKVPVTCITNLLVFSSCIDWTNIRINNWKTNKANNLIQIFHVVYNCVLRYEKVKCILVLVPTLHPHVISLVSVQPSHWLIISELIFGDLCASLQVKHAADLSISLVTYIHNFDIPAFQSPWGSQF